MDQPAWRQPWRIRWGVVSSPPCTPRSLACSTRRSPSPPIRATCSSERHREALAHLLYGLDAGGGFVLLTGEIGTGKTTVCRCFLEQIPAHCNVALHLQP